jgi:hypothetical protein
LKEEEEEENIDAKGGGGGEEGRQTMGPGAGRGEGAAKMSRRKP